MRASTTQPPLEIHSAGKLICHAEPGPITFETRIKKVIGDKVAGSGAENVHVRAGAIMESGRAPRRRKIARGAAIPARDRSGRDGRSSPN